MRALRFVAVLFITVLLLLAAGAFSYLPDTYRMLIYIIIGVFAVLGTLYAVY